MTPTPEQVLTIKSVLKSLPYTAPEIMGSMLYERLVEPLQRKIDALTVERDQLRTELDALQGNNNK